MPGIFVSYRRGPGSSPTAGRLYDRLVEEFETSRVFMDVDTIRPGRDFADTISRAIAEAKVLLAVIDPDWSGPRDTDGRSLIEHSDDFVRIEIETALHRGLRVIPVLIQGASMPEQDDLPTTLAPLASRQAITLTDERWNTDIVPLLRSLEEDIPRPKRWPITLRPLGVSVVALSLAAAITAGIVISPGDEDPGPIGSVEPDSTAATSPTTTTAIVTATSVVEADPISADERYNEAILGDNPVAYWPLGSAGSQMFRELVTDTAIRPVDDAIEAVPGPGSLTAVRFRSEQSQRILTDFDPRDQLGLGESWTIEAWLQTMSAEAQSVIGSFNTSNDQRWHLSSVAGNVQYGFGAPSSVQTDVPIADGDWHHVVIVVDTATSLATLWVDGTNTGAKPFDVVPDPPSATVAIGALRRVEGPRTWQSHWEGSLTRVAVYARTLSKDEIAHHHREGSADG